MYPLLPHRHFWPVIPDRWRVVHDPKSRVESIEFNSGTRSPNNFHSVQISIDWQCKIGAGVTPCTVYTPFRDDFATKSRLAQFSVGLVLSLGFFTAPLRSFLIQGDQHSLAIRNDDGTWTSATLFDFHTYFRCGFALVSRERDTIKEKKIKKKKLKRKKRHCQPFPMTLYPGVLRRMNSRPQ